MQGHKATSLSWFSGLGSIGYFEDISEARKCFVERLIDKLGYYKNMYMNYRYEEFECLIDACNVLNEIFTVDSLGNIIVDK